MFSFETEPTYPESCVKIIVDETNANGVSAPCPKES